jgi:SAM-dependent methyltransferase
MSKPAPYLLDVGDGDAARLALLDRIYGPYTESFLSRAGVARAMTVLDVGCGTGTVTSWIAAKVPPGGRVLGVDASEEQIAVARQAAAAAGRDNVEFRALWAANLDRLDRRFDVVFARFFLVHVTEPALVLRAMLDRLRPGGLLACDEQELAAACCVPAAPAFARSVDLAYRAARSRGTDLDYGKAVFGQFRELGCVDIELQVVQPALTSPATKRLWPMFFRSARPSLLQSGLIGEPELDAIIAGLDELANDDRCYCLAMRNHQVLGRRPALSG